MRLACGAGSTSGSAEPSIDRRSSWGSHRQASRRTASVLPILNFAIPMLCEASESHSSPSRLYPQKTSRDGHHLSFPCITSYLPNIKGPYVPPHSQALLKARAGDALYVKRKATGCCGGDDRGVDGVALTVFGAGVGSGGAGILGLGFTVAGGRGLMRQGEISPGVPARSGLC